MRSAGILLPIFSLPSKYGIGSFSKEAYEFIDFLAESGQKYWQILPLGPTGYGNSPYQSFSTFAGNPYFIDLESLHQYISKEEIDSYDWSGNPDYINYDKVSRNKLDLLKKAFERFDVSNHDFGMFCIYQAYWLDGYANYMARKEWQDPNLYKFHQYIFYNQWKNVKSYANSKGIEIIGDLPIYVSLDSSDVCDNPELFKLDWNGSPSAVAGCPPDDFSDNGQIWGNPLYNWDVHRQTGFKWWIERIRYCFELFDVVRIDHFRGLYDYFSIPYGDNTARNGHWEMGPGMDLFNAIRYELGDVKMIAEDLGMLSPGVIDLLKDTGFPGMKILHFAFNGGKDNPYLPENISENYVVYPGTHDNDTTIGWYNKASNWEREHFRSYVGDGVVHWKMIELAMSTRANMCIIPIQDYLGLGDNARINKPSTIGDNWDWRMREIPCIELAHYIRHLTEKYNRR